MQHPDPGRGSDYADNIREIMDRAARTDASVPAPPPASPVLTRGPVVAVVTAVFLLVVGYNLRTLQTPPPPLPVEEAEVSASLTVVVATQAVEAYRKEHGRLPASLAELGFPTEGLEYTVRGDAYEIRVVQGDAEVHTESGRPADGILSEMGIDVLEATSPPRGESEGRR